MKSIVSLPLRAGFGVAILALALVGVAICPVATAAEPSPWEALSAARRSLAAAGPTSARFVQTYVPAGFTSGERETGRLALALPSCLRWDYDEPYPKSFLICDDVVHYWNSADRSGRRQRIDSENEPGLDLLLLSVDALRGRYEASAEEDAGAVRVRLEPRNDQEIRGAVLTLDPASGRVTSLEYWDREGNRTRFTLTGYGPLERQGVFAPPSGITWEQG